MSSAPPHDGPMVGSQDTQRERNSRRYWGDLLECSVINQSSDHWDFGPSDNELVLTYERRVPSVIAGHRTGNPPYVNRIFALVDQMRDNPEAMQDIADESERRALLALGEAFISANSTQQTENLRTEFEELADSWREETAGYSLAAQYAAHPAYRRIIGMGRPVLPLIFERLATQGGRWYVALHAITNASPVPPEHKGQLDKVRQAWLNWARDNDVIS